MKRPRWRFIALLAAFASLAILLRVGWSIAQDRIAQWIDTEHENAGWRWRVFGGRRDGWRIFRADSVKAWNSTIEVRLRLVSLGWAPSENAYAIPATASLSARRLDIAYRPADSKDSSAPSFPASFQIPLEISLQLDSMLLGPSQGRDSGKTILVIQGIEARTLSPRSLELELDRLDPRGIALRVGAHAHADWTDSDTLRARVSGLVSTGCCEQDSLKAQAALTKTDLRKGRFSLATEIENSRGWSEIVPSLAKAPAAHQVGIEAEARLSSGKPELHARIRFLGDSVSFLPKMRYDLEATLDSVAGTIALHAFHGDRRTIDAKLSAAVPKKLPLWKGMARGDIRIDDLGWSLRGFDHPLDGTVDVERLDRIGAKIRYATDAGSTVNGSVAWKGLHWNLDARTSPTEPWVVGWVDGLAMEGEATARGSDSAGGASFHVTARRPRMKVVALDSLSTALWIGPGPHLVFSGIRAHDSGRVWVGEGDISIPDARVRYGLRPLTDSVANAGLEAGFDGRVRISAASFPTKGLPLRLPFDLPFDGVLDGELLHEPPLQGTSSSWVSARLRAKPRSDSLVAQIELVLRDSSIGLPHIGLRIGASNVEGSLAASQSGKGWGIDTLRLGTEHLDLASMAGLWPGIPSLRGRLRGHFLSQRNQGVSASARLESPAIVGADKTIPLPDLLLWGERDTLNLGGWIPLAGTKSPFRLTATHLWDPTPEFKLRTFWGDIVKLEAEGSFKEKKDLSTTFRITGATQLPGSDAHLNNILLTGGFQGHVGDKGFDWDAQVHGKRGVLTALERNPLDLRFEAHADPTKIHLDTFTLSGVKNGRFDGNGSWDIAKSVFTGKGQANKFRLDLGTDKSLFLDSLGIRATPDSRVRLAARDVFWHQTYSGKDERLDIGISRTNLVFVQAKDWKKLSGDLSVDKLWFSKNFAQPTDLIKSATDMVRRRRKPGAGGGSSSSSPLLLDITATSEGEDIRVANNLGQASLGFNLQVTGPTETPLINGFVEANPDSGRFGYLRRTFSLDTLRLDWNTSPLLQGKFQLSGSHTVRRNCNDESKSASIDSATAFCHLILASHGSLEDPRLSGLTSDCATDPGDDGTVGAFVALATDCYPNANNQSNKRWGDVALDGGKEWAYGFGMGMVNDILTERLGKSRSSAEWLPDSVMLTDFPVPGTRDQLGLLALYHITPELDLAGVYRHTFTQSGTSSTNTGTVLSDDYGLSLKYRIPFAWIEEEEIRKRLSNRVFLQLDFDQGIDENSRRSTTYQPSLRYRWEFW